MLSDILVAKVISIWKCEEIFWHEFVIINMRIEPTVAEKYNGTGTASEECGFGKQFITESNKFYGTKPAVSCSLPIQQ